MKNLFKYILVLGLLGVFSCGEASDTPAFEVPEPKEGNVKGVVSDENGNPISGVVVSDGRLSTQTDKFGIYALSSDLSKVHFVQVSIPSGYQAPVVDGLPIFYERIPKGTQTVEANFRLNRSKNTADRYTLFISADPQIRAKSAGYDNFGYHSIEVMEDVFLDMKDLSTRIKNKACYGVCLGDIVHNNMSLYKDYCDRLSTLDFPTFHVIGNHDHDQTAITDSLAMVDYEKYLGPTNYSFDLGKIHYIVLDNIIMNNSAGAGKYISGLSEEVYEWLKGDLAHVGKDKILMIFSHSGLYMKRDNDPTKEGGDKNSKGYTQIFSQYKYVHSWAGHNHINFNYVYSKQDSKFQNVESHIVGRSTGSLWLNEKVSSDGTPRGYYVVDVNGEDISWYFKPCTYDKGENIKLDSSYQLQAYLYDDGYVYVNVWGYDALWGDVKYTDSNLNEVNMQQFTTYDMTYMKLCDYYNSSFPNVGFEYDNKVDHMFRIRPSSDAISGNISVVDRFGKKYSTKIYF